MKLEKAAKKFEGARSPYMLSTGKKAWYRKEGLKWKYDSMVTPVEEKDWMEAWEKKKKLKEMKAKTGETEAKLKTQAADLQKQAAAKKAAGPSAADIAAAGTRSKLYYEPTTSDRARKLCDMTGILCLDKTAEDYVENNMNTIFQMSADQKKEMRGMNPMYPLDTDGKFSEDPVFMEDTLIALRKYKKEMIASGKAKEMAKEKIKADYLTQNQQTLNNDTADALADEDIKYLTLAADEWIDSIERHENDKVLMGKIRTVEQSLTGARVVSSLPTMVSKSILPDMYIQSPSYGPDRWTSLAPEAQEILTTLGLDATKVNTRARSIDRTSLAAMIYCALDEDVTEALRVWFEGTTVKDPQGNDFYVPGGANVENPNAWIKYTNNHYVKGDAEYWDFENFKTGAKQLRKKYAGQAALVSKVTKVYDPGKIPTYEFDQYNPGHNEGVVHAELVEFLSGRTLKYGKGAESGQMVSISGAKWGDMADGAREMLKTTLNTDDNTKKALEGIIETSKVVGDIYLRNTVDEAQKMIGKLHRDLSQPMKEQISFSDTTMAEVLSASLGGSQSDNVSLAFQNDFTVPDSGFIGYRLARRHAEYGVQYSSGSRGGRRRRASRGGSAETEKFGENVKLKQALKQKFFMRFSVMPGDYSRARGRNTSVIIHPENHGGASILAAIGVNWQVRKLAKKAQAIPDWKWGDLTPFGKNNPILAKGGADNIKKRDFTKAIFDKLVTDSRNNSIAANIGLMKRELKAVTASGIRKPDIVLRTNVDGVAKWNDKVKKEWTHSASSDAPPGSMEVKAVFDIMYHPYYDKYKAIEQARGNVQYAWHGTDFEAGAKIIKMGYLVPHRAKTGRSLGDGVYVSTSSSKVGGYFLNGHWGRGGHGVMFWNRIAMGNMKNLQTGDVSGGPGGSDIHTSFAPGGYRFGHDEHCVHAARGTQTFAMIPIQWVDVGPPGR